MRGYKKINSVALMVRDLTLLHYGKIQKLPGRASPSFLPVHISLSMCESGRPFGVMDVDPDFRAGIPIKPRRRRENDDSTPEDEIKQEPDSAFWLRGLTKATEMAHLAPNRRIISVADQEGDFWEMYTRQAAEPALGFLIGVKNGNRYQIEEGHHRLDLESYMESLEPCALAQLATKAQNGSKVSRQQVVYLELRIAKVNLVAPPNETPAMLPLTAVLVCEVGSKKLQPVRWLLLCSEGHASAMWAIRIKCWYEIRMLIKDYFLILKNSTRIHDPNIRTAGAIGKCLAFDAITSWRLFEQDYEAGKLALPKEIIKPPSDNNS